MDESRPGIRNADRRPTTLLAPDARMLQLTPSEPVPQLHGVFPARAGSIPPTGESAFSSHRFAPAIHAAASLTPAWAPMFTHMPATYAHPFFAGCSPAPCAGRLLRYQSPALPPAKTLQTIPVVHFGAPHGSVVGRPAVPALSARPVFHLTASPFAARTHPVHLSLDHSGEAEPTIPLFRHYFAQAPEHVTPVLPAQVLPELHRPRAEHAGAAHCLCRAEPWGMVRCRSAHEHPAFRPRAGQRHPRRPDSDRTTGTQPAPELQQQDKGAQEIALLATEVWSILKNRLSMEADRRGRW